MREVGESQINIESIREVVVGMVTPSPFPRLEKRKAVATSHFPHREGSSSAWPWPSLSLLTLRSSGTIEEVGVGMVTTSVSGE